MRNETILKPARAINSTIKLNLNIHDPSPAREPHVRYIAVVVPD